MIAKLGKTKLWSLWCLFLSNLECLILKIFLFLNRGIISERQKKKRCEDLYDGYLKKKLKS